VPLSPLAMYRAHRRSRDGPCAVSLSARAHAQLVRHESMISVGDLDGSYHGSAIGGSVRSNRRRSVLPTTSINDVPVVPRIPTAQNLGATNTCLSCATSDMSAPATRRLKTSREPDCARYIAEGRELATPAMLPRRMYGGGAPTWAVQHRAPARWFDGARSGASFSTRACGRAWYSGCSVKRRRSVPIRDHVVRGTPADCADSCVRQGILPWQRGAVRTRRCHSRHPSRNLAARCRRRSAGR